MEPSPFREMIVFTLRKAIVLIWIIFAKLRAATFFSLQRGARDRFGNGQQIFQIERGVPAGIEFAIPIHANVSRALPKLLQLLRALLSFRLRCAQSRLCPASSLADRVAPEYGFSPAPCSNGFNASLAVASIV